jgi:hypothetical protein
MAQITGWSQIRTFFRFKCPEPDDCRVDCFGDWRLRWGRDILLIIDEHDYYLFDDTGAERVQARLRSDDEMSAKLEPALKRLRGNIY